MRHNSVTIAFVALGANDSADTRLLVTRLKQVIAELASSDVKLVAQSRFFKTPCFPAGYGNDFVNAAIAVETELSPGDLLSRLHEVEALHGRARKLRWGTRSLDLDLIAYGACISPDLATYERWRDLPVREQEAQAPDTLILPHPRLQERAFVLVPLADVATDWRHPVDGRTVEQMRDALPVADIEAIEPLNF